MKHSKKKPAQPPCDHHGQQKVRVGPYSLRLGGTFYLRQGDVEYFAIDLLVPLTHQSLNGGFPFKFGQRYQILAGALVDYGGVPPNWKEFLDEVIKELSDGQNILAFCVGSHGRTGCFLASLIALLESAEETPDPIQAARDRHCHKAVETRAQAEAVFALRGEALPEKYRVQFQPQATPVAQPHPQG